MELVYLWVEEYKNIKRQGFNFSPRFRCEYDDKNKTIEILEKKNYTNIFSDNINITAIVGENGSGKTTLFEILSKIYLYENIENIFLITVSFDKNDKNSYVFQSTKKDIKYSNGKLVQEIFSFNRNFSFSGVYYSPNFTNSGLNNIIEEFVTPLKFKHKKEISQVFDNGLTPRNNFKNQSLLNLFINSSRVIENHPTDSVYRNKNAFTIKDNFNNINLAKTIVILHFMYLFGKDYLSFNKENDFVKISIIENKTMNQIYNQNFIEKLEKALELKTIFTNDEDEKEYKKQVHKDYNKEKEKFLNFCKQNFPKKVIFYDTISMNLDDALLLVNHYLKLYGLNRNLDFNILNFEYKSLSSGEENLLLMYALLELGITSFISKSNQLKISIFLDEIENNIHPKKQKALVYKTLEFLTNVSNHWKKKDKEISFNVYFASHSPFLISDIPKDNIMFLSKYDKNDIAIKNGIQLEGNCKVNNESSISQTFGANIHTLLSHGFFMKDGLMGEFAKSKIESIKDFYEDCKDLKIEAEKYNDKKDEYLNKKEEFRYIQSIIGEPFIKNIMKNYLDELDVLFIGKNEFIDEEIKRLEAMKD